MPLDTVKVDSMYNTYKVPAANTHTFPVQDPETKVQAGEVWYVGRKLFWGELGSKSAGSVGNRMVSSRHYTAVLHKRETAREEAALALI